MGPRPAKKWSPSAQDQVIHGGKSPVPTSVQDPDPEWRLSTAPTGRESRFEEWTAGSTGINHKPGRGNPFRMTLNPRTQPWNEAWDYRHHHQEIPQYNPLSDPHCEATFAWTTEHQALKRMKRRRREPLGCDYSVWQQLLADKSTHHRLYLQKEREKRPWPEYEPEIATSGGRGWKDVGPGPMPVMRAQKYFSKGYTGDARQGNSDTYATRPEVSRPSMLLQATVPPPLDSGMFSRKWMTTQMHKKRSGTIYPTVSKASSPKRAVCNVWAQTIPIQGRLLLPSPQKEVQGHYQKHYSI